MKMSCLLIHKKILSPNVPDKLCRGRDELKGTGRIPLLTVCGRAATESPESLFKALNTRHL